MRMSYDGAAAFLEEAQDLLTELEATLLELEKHPTDRELVQRAFRALHTVKGSGAMFGFDEVSRFAHELETAFDQVRGGRLKPSPQLISLTLEARDQIQAMLAGSSGQSPADIAGRAEILKKLTSLLGNPDGHREELSV